MVSSPKLDKSPGENQQSQGPDSVKERLRRELKGLPEMEADLAESLAENWPKFVYVLIAGLVLIFAYNAYSDMREQSRGDAGIQFSKAQARFEAWQSREDELQAAKKAAAEKAKEEEKKVASDTQTENKEEKKEEPKELTAQDGADKEGADKKEAESKPKDEVDPVKVAEEELNRSIDSFRETMGLVAQNSPSRGYQVLSDLYLAAGDMEQGDFKSARERLNGAFRVEDVLGSQQYVPTGELSRDITKELSVLMYARALLEEAHGQEEAVAGKLRAQAVKSSEWLALNGTYSNVEALILLFHLSRADFSMEQLKDLGTKVIQKNPEFRELLSKELPQLALE